MPLDADRSWDRASFVTSRDIHSLLATRFDLRPADVERDGADVGQVVNARSGMTANGNFTTTGTTRTGNASRGLARGQRRMTPELIYKQAKNRAEARDLLGGEHEAGHQHPALQADALAQLVHHRQVPPGAVAPGDGGRPGGGSRGGGGHQ